MSRLWPAVLAALPFALLGGSCSSRESAGNAEADAASVSSASSASSSSAGSGSGSGGADAGSNQDAGAPQVRMALVTTAHRATATMFGGWGQNLGHLLQRDGGELWFADDACDDAGADVCDTQIDRRIEYSRFGDGAWQKITSVALPSRVQQNTGSIVTSDG